ncbi:kinase-like protein, partial [Rhizoctonia solani]
MSGCNHSLSQPLTTFSSCEFDTIDKVITRGAHADLVCGTLRVVGPRKRVAVKAFRRVAAQDKISIENELVIWRLLCAHPHIASFIGIVPTDSYHPKYFSQGPVSDYYVHGDLNMYLYKIDPDVNNHEMRFLLLLGVIRGLAYIHSQSIVHGDLKASNVLIDGEGYVARICDFGSSRIECGCYSGPQTQEGTLAWDSPELWYDPLAEGESDEEDDDNDVEERVRPRTQKSDVWAFGCVALEVQMGMAPWDPEREGNLRKMCARQYNAGTGHPVQESALELHCHPIASKVWSMIQDCWEANPSQRPESSNLMTLCEVLAQQLKTM